MSTWIHDALAKHRRDPVDIAAVAVDVEVALAVYPGGPIKADAERGVRILRGLAEAVDGDSVKGLRDVADGPGHPSAPVILNKIIDAIEKVMEP